MFLEALGLGLGLGALGLVGSAMTNSANRDNAEWSARFQDRMSWEHWRAQNEYNRPINQMARLREAGLNPLLVYGSGGVTGNSSAQASVPNVSTPESNYDMSGFARGIMMYQDLASKDVQMQLNDAQTQYTLAKAAKVKQDMAMDLFNRQNPARSATALASGSNDLKSFMKKVGGVAGASGGALFGLRKLKSGFTGSPSNGNILSSLGSYARSSWNYLKSAFSKYSPYLSLLSLRGSESQGMRSDPRWKAYEARMYR